MTSTARIAALLALLMPSLVGTATLTANGESTRMLRSPATACPLRARPPASAIAGRDPQLERAVEEALTLLKAKPADRMTTEPQPPTWGKRPGE